MSEGKIRAALAGAAVIVLWPVSAAAQRYSGHDGMGWGGGWGHGIFGPLAMLVLLAILVGAIVMIVRWAGGQHGGGGDRALDILKERFARGEIEKEEFEERRRLL